MPFATRACGWLAETTREDADWTALSAWLEADPLHQAAFARAALVEGEAIAALGHDKARPAGTLARPLQRASRAWRWSIAAGAIAATFVAVLLPGGRLRREHAVSASTSYANAAGERRAFALADGSRVVLDARSRLSVTAGGRHAELAAGAAWFEVRHDAARPFVVTVGRIVVRDVGTRFEVVRGPGRASVAVGEGVVAVDRTGTAAAQGARGRARRLARRRGGRSAAHRHRSAGRVAQRATRLRPRAARTGRGRYRALRGTAGLGRSPAGGDPVHRRDHDRRWNPSCRTPARVAADRDRRDARKHAAGSARRRLASSCRATRSRPPARASTCPRDRSQPR